MAKKKIETTPVKKGKDKHEMVHVRRKVNRDGKESMVTLPYRREIAERLVTKGLGTIVKITVIEEKPEVKAEESVGKDPEPTGGLSGEEIL